MSSAQVSRDGTPQPVTTTTVAAAAAVAPSDTATSATAATTTLVQPQQQVSCSPRTRICVVLVDGFGFVSSCDYNWTIDPWDQLLVFIRRSLKERIAEEQNIPQSMVNVVFPEKSLHAYFPDVGQLTMLGKVSTSQMVVQGLLRSLLQRGDTAQQLPWTFNESPLKQSNGVWQATVEDIKLTQDAAKLAEAGAFDPIGSNPQRTTATDIFIVTADGDHVQTLDSATGGGALRWCVTFGKSAAKLRGWGNRTQRLLHFQFGPQQQQYGSSSSGAATGSGNNNNNNSALQQQQHQPQRRQRDHKNNQGDAAMPTKVWPQRAPTKVNDAGTDEQPTISAATLSNSALSGSNNNNQATKVCLSYAMCNFCPGEASARSAQQNNITSAAAGGAGKKNNNNNVIIVRQQPHPPCNLYHRRPAELCTEFVLRGKCSNADSCRFAHCVGASSSVQRSGPPRAVSHLDDLAVAALMDLYACPPQVAQRELLLAAGNIQAAAAALDALAAQLQEKQKQQMMMSMTQ